MKPTEDQINDAMCKVSFPFFPGMTRGETERKVKQFVAELFNIVGTQTSVPEGWKLVPVEPTPEMVEKGIFSAHGYPAKHRVRMYYELVWEGMLEAAPKFGEEE